MQLQRRTTTHMYQHTWDARLTSRSRASKVPNTSRRARAAWKSRTTGVAAETCRAGRTGWSPEADRTRAARRAG